MYYFFAKFTRLEINRNNNYRYFAGMGYIGGRRSYGSPIMATSCGPYPSNFIESKD